MSAEESTPSSPEQRREIQKRLLSRAAAAESVIPRAGGAASDAGRTFAKDAKLFRDAAREISALEHDLERAMANHTADLNSVPQSERGERDAARWRALEERCQWVSFCRIGGAEESFDPRDPKHRKGMRAAADELPEAPK